jgi:hopene-associated glycosyltransferase HpnB
VRQYRDTPRTPKVVVSTRSLRPTGLNHRFGEHTLTATIIGVATAAIWLYLIAFRGAFWRLRRRGVDNRPAIRRSIVAVIPARDEAAVIGRALASLFSQDYAGSFRIVLVDDDSHDGTAAKARAAAEAAGAADRLTIVEAEPVPVGWTGKLWAVHHGVAIAREFRPDYLLLTDADIVHGVDALRELVARAEGGGYSLVSLMVRLNCRSIWERLLIPAFVFFFFKLYPPSWVADLRRRTAAAAGGCMLVRRETLDRVGGIVSIRREIIDDCALARRIKAAGKVWLGAATHSHSIREYRSWRPIWDMIARCAFAQLRYSAALLVAVVSMMAVVYLAPPLLLLTGDPLAMTLGAAAWLAMSIAFLPILLDYECPPPLALLLPLVALFYTGATIASAVQFWRGRGGSWKGRFQAAPAS